MDKSSDAPADLRDARRMVEEAEKLLRFARSIEHGAVLRELARQLPGAYLNTEDDNACHWYSRSGGKIRIEVRTDGVRLWFRVQALLDGDVEVHEGPSARDALLRCGADYPALGELAARLLAGVANG